MRWLEGAQVRARKDIERYVLPNEKVLIATRRHWASLTGPIAKALPALLIGGWLLTLEPSNKISSAVGLFLVVVGVGYLGLCAVDWWARHFIVTSHSVLLTSGVLVRQVTLVQLRRITDLTWRETLLGRRLGYGTLRMEVAGGGRRASWPVRFLPHADTLFRSFSELLLRADNNDADRLFRSFSELLLRAEDDDDF
jgi:membrane protein YdbS with pleckstrin-like domain